MDCIKTYLSKVFDWFRTHMTVPNILAAVRLLLHRIKVFLAHLFAWLSAKVHAWFPRMGWSAAATLGLGFVVFLIAPQQIGVLIYKLVCITAGAVVMYYVFRELFPYNRPSLLLEKPDASGFRVIKSGCQVRYWIAVALQGLAAIAGALAVALAL